MSSHSKGRNVAASPVRAAIAVMLFVSAVVSLLSVPIRASALSTTPAASTRAARPIQQTPDVISAAATTAARAVTPLNHSPLAVASASRAVTPASKVRALAALNALAPRDVTHMAGLRMIPAADFGTPSDFVMSKSVLDLLNGALHIPIGSGELSGNLNGSVLTVSLDNPSAVPFDLPAGLAAVTWGTTTAAIDISEKSLELTTSATIGSSTLSLDVQIANADSTALTAADFTATLSLTDLPVLGTTIDITGTLGYSNKQLTGSITGTLSSNFAVATGLTVMKGTAVTLDSRAGLSVSGTVEAGTEPNSVTIGVSGSIANVNTWTLTLTQSATSGWQPFDGLTINPNLTGTVSKAAGRITFDVAADEAATWTPTPPLLAHDQPCRGGQRHTAIELHEHHGRSLLADGDRHRACRPRRRHPVPDRHVRLHRSDRGEVRLDHGDDRERPGDTELHAEGFHALGDR